MRFIKLLGMVLVSASLALGSMTAFAAPVNVNTADAKTLAENIQGVGPKKADAIIAYRKSKGPFKTVEELANVKGIGSKLIERNRGDLYLNDTGLKKSMKVTASN